MNSGMNSGMKSIMNSGATVESLLERLLASRSLRRAWSSGRTDLLSPDVDHLRVLATLDPDALEDAATLYCRDVMRRGHRGSGSLIDRYPATIAAWRARHPEVSHDDDLLDELAAQLCDSSEFEDYRSRAGACLEEVFYRFACRCDIGDPAVREREYLAAIAIAVAVNPEPVFRLPREWRATDSGGFAIASHGPRHLFAVAGQRVIDGAITDLVADLLLTRESPDSLATRHRVPRAHVAEVAASLADMGLSRLASPPLVPSDW